MKTDKKEHMMLFLFLLTEAVIDSLKVVAKVLDRMLIPYMWELL